MFESFNDPRNIFWLYSSFLAYGRGQKSQKLLTNFMTQTYEYAYKRNTFHSKTFPICLFHSFLKRLHVYIHFLANSFIQNSIFAHFIVFDTYCAFVLLKVPRKGSKCIRITKMCKEIGRNASEWVKMYQNFVDLEDF